MCGEELRTEFKIRQILAITAVHYGKILMNIIKRKCDELKLHE